MLQAISHSFPSNAWIHRITKGKESNKCDLCKALWIKENRFTTEADLPEQDLGHVQHTCEALAEAHTAAHHRCWRLIHGELARLASSKWRFMCITGEKSLRDNLAGTHGRIQRRPTMAESHERFYMERSEGSRNESPPHPGRIETNTGRPNQRNNSANQILATKTGWHSVLSAYRN
jgi:hypothetical protein